MATISKRNGIKQKSWQVRIRHSGLPLLIKSFPSKIEAKNWAADDYNETFGSLEPFLK